MAKISLNELRSRTSTVDRAKLDATTEIDIEAQQIEDGYIDMPIPETARTVESPRSLRVRLGMTQPEMASALGIPLGTWRNWEQGRVSLEPAASALLRIVSYNPDMALDALAHPDIQPPSRIADVEKRIAEVKQRLSEEAEARNIAFHGRDASPEEIKDAVVRLARVLGLEGGREKLTA